MPKQTQAGATGSSLTDFTFDNDIPFFGIEPEGQPAEDEVVIAEVKEKPKPAAAKAKAKPDLEDGEVAEVASDEDEVVDDEPFFGIPSGAIVKDEEEEESESEVEEPEEEEDPKTKPAKAKVKAESSNKTKVEAEDKENPEGDDKFFTTLANEMKEKGIFQNIEIKEDEEISEDDFFELQDKEINARVEETFESFFEELDQDAKDFLKFKKDGGKTADFFTIMKMSAPVGEEFDVENEEHRNKIITHYLATEEKLDAEEIADKIKWLKEGGKEKVFAEKYYQKIKDKREKTKAAVVKAQAQRAAELEEEAKEFSSSLGEVLTKTESIGAFSITKADQKELTSYITKPTVKVGKNRFIPAFQADIAKIFTAETEQDKKNLLLLAKLIKGKFDVSDVQTKAKTEATKKVKSKLAEAKSGARPISSGNSGTAKKSIADYF